MDDSKKSEQTDDGYLPFNKVEERLDRRRKDILGVLRAVDSSPQHSGRMNSSELREEAGVPSGSMTNHTKKLERWGLIEETGREYAGGGSNAIVWELTERGRTFCETVLDEIRALPTAAEVSVLSDRIADLETHLDELEEQRQADIDDLEARVEGLVQQLRRDLIGENGTDAPGRDGQD